jgi:bleomycin resistance family protein
MQDNRPRFIGTELYFDDLERAKRFYRDTLGLELSEEMPGHHAKFDFAAEFLCLEQKVRSPIHRATRRSSSSRCRTSPCLFAKSAATVSSMWSRRQLRSAPHGPSFMTPKDTTSSSLKNASLAAGGADSKRQDEFRCRTLRF